MKMKYQKMLKIYLHRFGEFGYRPKLILHLSVIMISRVQPVWNGMNKKKGTKEEEILRVVVQVTFDKRFLTVLFQQKYFKNIYGYGYVMVM